MKKTCPFIWHIDQSLQQPCKKAALENISQEMYVAGWYITHHNAALGTKTRLICFALIGCTLFNWVSCIADRRRQLSCVSEGVYSDATQLNSTSSWVKLRRYKRAFSIVSMDHSSCNTVTIVRAISKYAIVVLVLVIEFIKTTFEHFGRCVAFVRAM